MPALAVAHGRIGYTLEEINTLFDAVEEFMRLGVPDLLHAGLLDLQEETVELLPHLGTDVLAHLPRIFARRRYTGHNG